MISKEILIQYSDLQEEVKEIRKKIEQLEDEIPKIQKRVNEIEGGATVRDKVYGGYGGIQGFQIEGVPVKEYSRNKTSMQSKMLALNQRKANLEKLEFDLLQKTNEVEEFIASIDDSHIRRIINLRFIENLPWAKVAACVGGGNTDDSVRKYFERFMERNEAI